MNRKSIITSILLFGVGVAISQASFRRVDFTTYAMNPFAIRQSGYGMMMARLSQDTVNRVWHSGIESSDHDHSKCTNPDHHHDHDSHDHSGHDDHANGGISFTSVVEGIHSHLEGLSNAKGARTSRYGLTERHKKNTARDIESTLLRSYRMDPTNYGVYNAYYLFLTIHELGATEADRIKAASLSEHTIAEANKEFDNPEAWLTAASASLNLFFAEQGKRKIAGSEFTAKELQAYQVQLGGCISNFVTVVEKRKTEGTWDLVSEVRKSEMLERARFAGKTHEQFAAMLKRIAKNEKRLGADPVEELVENTISE